jgi:hypothetical protein
MLTSHVVGSRKIIANSAVLMDEREERGEKERRRKKGRVLSCK